MARPLHVALISLILIGTLASSANGQVHERWTYLGLGDTSVWSIQIHSGQIFVGTDDGVFVRNLSASDTLWAPLGLQGREVKSVLAMGSTLYAGIRPTGSSNDTVLVYTSVDAGESWTPSLTSHDGWEVLDLEAHPDQPLTIYAARRSDLKKSENGGISWETQSPYPAIYNTVRQAPSDPSMVWTGGENLIFWPVLARSFDGGFSWDPDILTWSTGDNAVDCIEIDPLDAERVYLGMESFVLRSDDGGENWNTLLENVFYNYAVGLDPVDPSIVYVSGGASNPPENESVYLFRSEDRGDSWETLFHTPGTDHYWIKDIEVVEQGDATRVYLAGTGVFEYYRATVTSVDPGESSPGPVMLSGYPNPFREQMTINYVLPRSASVTLKVFDLLGRQVASLREGPEPAGSKEVIWNARNNAGEPLVPGIYFIRILIEGQERNVRIVLLP